MTRLRIIFYFEGTLCFFFFFCRPHSLILLYNVVVAVAVEAEAPPTVFKSNCKMLRQGTRMFILGRGCLNNTNNTVKGYGIRLMSDDGDGPRFSKLAENEKLMNKKKRLHEENKQESPYAPLPMSDRNEGYFQRTSKKEKMIGVFVTESRKNEMFELHRKDNLLWDVSALGKQFQLSKLRVNAILRLKELEWEMFGTVEEETVENEKPIRESIFDMTPPKEKCIEPVDPVPPAPIRDPLFAFLGDQDEPIVMTRSRKDPRSTVYGDSETYDRVLRRQNEAIEKNVKEEDDKHTILPSFNSFTTRSINKWKIAVKDLSRPKEPLMMRNEKGELRLATALEATARTWVRRPHSINQILMHHGKTQEEGETVVQPNA